MLQARVASHVGVSQQHVSKLIRYYETETGTEAPPKPDEITMDKNNLAPRGAKELSEFVSRQIRLAPPEVQEQLRKDRQRKAI